MGATTHGGMKSSQGSQAHCPSYTTKSDRDPHSILARGDPSREKVENHCALSVLTGLIGRAGSDLYIDFILALEVHLYDPHSPPSHPTSK